MIRRLPFLAVLTAVVLAAASASAGVVGNGLQNFNATPDGLDFVTINSSETLKPGVINLGLFLNYAVNPLPYVGNSPQGRLDFNDTVLGMDLNIGVGILPGWEVGLSAPSVLAQTVSATQQLHGEFKQTGSTEIRPSTKVRLLGDDSGGLAVVGSINFNRTIDNPYTGVDPGPTYNLELAWDTTIKPAIALGVNAGYRFAHPGAPVPGAPVSPIGDQITAGAAASYLIPHTDTKVIGEIFGAIPPSHVNSDLDRSSTSFEFLAGIKHDFTHQIAFHAGAGTGLGNGISSPDWRIYTGINFTVGPVFAKGSAYTRAPEEEKFTLRHVIFEFDSDEMTGGYADALSEISVALARQPYSKLVIEGHTDSIGNAAYNQALSLKRASKIKEYLVRVHGLDGAKIEIQGMGATVPLADNGNFQGRQENRRVELRVIR